MAKRRIVRRRAPARRITRRRAARGMSPNKVILPALAYGAGRGYLAGLVAPLTSKVPLGNYADEIVMGGLGYLAAKKGKGMIKNIGLSMLTVEAASIGNQLTSGMNNGGSNSSGNQWSTW